MKEKTTTKSEMMHIPWSNSPKKVVKKNQLGIWAESNQLDGVQPVDWHLKFWHNYIYILTHKELLLTEKEKSTFKLETQKTMREERICSNFCLEKSYRKEHQHFFAAS
jgi:hypothetical protein